MTDDDLEQRVKGILQRVDSLQHSQEYGQFAREYGQLLRDLYGKMERMEAEIDVLIEDVKHEKDGAVHLYTKVRDLEEDMNKLKSVPTPSKEFKPGRLGVALTHRVLHNSYLNGLKIAITREAQKEEKHFGTTRYGYGKAFYAHSKDNLGNDIPPANAYCEFTELPGGTYAVEVKYESKIYGCNVTIDGDTFAELKLSRSNEKREGISFSDKHREEALASTPWPASKLPSRFSTGEKIAALSIAAALGAAIMYGTAQHCARNSITFSPEQVESNK